MLDTVFFCAFAAVTIAGALATVTLHNAVHCAVGLTASLVGVAGIFLLQAADFLSVAQIIVYVGGVMLLFLFVIMLVNVSRSKQERRFSPGAGLAVGISVVAGAIALYLLTSQPLILATPARNDPSEIGNTETIGTALFTTYLLPFEVTSVLLLAALIGSVILARTREPGI